ncbi:hypothetical protein IFM5058_03354 [Aspergillus udagawae]|nr:hypothetical protein IFM5058_03354 [Aspergillus udagawae]
MTSRSSRSSISDYHRRRRAPLLRVLSVVAVAKPGCQSLTQKVRHAAAESAGREDRDFDKVLEFSMVIIRWFKRSVSTLISVNASSTLAIPVASPLWALSAYWRTARIYPVTYRTFVLLFSK